VCGADGLLAFLGPQWNEWSPQFEVTMAERVYVVAASSVLEAGLWVRHVTPPP
jgi:hypothetical protein